VSTTPRSSASASKVASALDRVAIGLSGLCAVHCIVTPIAVALLPIVSATIVPGGAFHGLMAVLILPSSILALTLGCRRHRDIWVLGAGTAGLILLIAALNGSDAWETPLTLSASAMIVAAHVRNYQLCRREDSECCESAAEPPSTASR